MYKALSLIALGVLVISCNDKQEDKNNLFPIDFSAIKGQYTAAEALPLTVLNPEKLQIDSVVYYLGDKKVGSVKGNEKLTVPLKDAKLGYQDIKATTYYSDGYGESGGRIEIISSVKAKILSYEIVNTYPHDVTSYTQGLEFYRDTLVEGTGQYGQSVLQKENYKTGEAYKKVGLDSKYFGEGVTIFNNKIYQLTWKENTGFIYNADNLTKIKDFNYTKAIQGWGLTHDDKYLYQSDGSEKIYKLDPETLQEVDYINVYAGDRKIKELNELEYVNGKIYANVYQTNGIMVIDPDTGAVTGILNMADLETKINKTPQTNVLNGIAYNPKTGTFFITGKLWDKMFEVRVKE
jgi:glutaminyl-peptide cyclotransferase